MKKVILVLACVAIAMAACKTSKEGTKTETVVAKPLDCATSGLTLASIKPIIEGNCTGCHGYGGDAGYNFLSTADIIRAGKNGELLGTIKHAKGFKRMPANAEQLDQASIDKIECWISNGMKE